MKNSEEIVELLKREAENAKDITQIPNNIALSEKVLLVDSRQKLYDSLQRIIDLVEDKKVGEIKQSPKSLFP